MRINQNISAMNTYSRLTSANTAKSNSLAKLSSGLRINKAGDDAAGLAISEKMRGQVSGLNQAAKNAQDGISLIQTAEGALSETHSILQRMRELAVQSANDTNTADDRNEIQKEIDQLVSEIDRISTDTEFNTKKLLNGGSSVNANVTGAGGSNIKFLGGSADTKVGNAINITSTTAATADTAKTTADTLTQNSALAASSDITINGVKFSFGTTDTVGDALETINGAGLGVTASLDGAGAINFTSDKVGSKSDMTISDVGGSFAGAAVITEGKDASIVMTEGLAYTADGNKITVQAGDVKGLEFEVLKTDAVNASKIDVLSNGGLNMHIGANEGQSMYVSIGDMRASALGINGIDVTTTSGAESAISTVDEAIKNVSGERSKLGAYQNRLDHTINNLTTTSENLSAAESRIRDVDMAQEMMEFTKNNILSQAATSMLAQANQMPQSVLQLLQ